MKNKLRNHRGGIDSIIIALVLIIFVLVSIPMFKGVSNSNVKSASSSVSTFNKFSSDVTTFVNSNSGGTTSNPFN